jgi:hypothetical protein
MPSRIGDELRRTPHGGRIVAALLGVTCQGTVSPDVDVPRGNIDFAIRWTG